MSVEPTPRGHRALREDAQENQNPVLANALGRWRSFQAKVLVLILVLGTAVLLGLKCLELAFMPASTNPQAAPLADKLVPAAMSTMITIASFFLTALFINVFRVRASQRNALTSLASPGNEAGSYRVRVRSRYPEFPPNTQALLTAALEHSAAMPSAWKYLGELITY